MEQFHPLDRLINDNSLSLLEALVPFVDYPYKQLLVLFIKYKEAMAILQCFQNRDFVMQQGFDCHPKSSEDFLNDLCKILPKQYSNGLQNMQQMMQVMQMMDMTGTSQTNSPRTNNSDINLFNSVMDILNETN